MVLEDRIPRFDAGGELGLQDVIVLRYDYSLRTGIPDRQQVNSYEKFYYSREWGWIQWEYYQDDDLQKNPPTLRKRFRCNRRPSGSSLRTLRIPATARASSRWRSTVGRCRHSFPWLRRAPGRDPDLAEHRWKRVA
jgi:hypothetical protein